MEIYTSGHLLLLEPAFKILLLLITGGCWGVFLGKQIIEVLSGSVGSFGSFGSFGSVGSRTGSCPLSFGSCPRIFFRNKLLCLIQILVEHR